MPDNSKTKRLFGLIKIKKAKNYKKVYFCGVRIYYKKTNSFCYTQDVISTAKSVGIGLKVNAPSRVSKNTSLGDYVNFNGMKISGGGECKIGNYFHSGEGCHILTQNHNYDNGTEIPYDSTYIYKDVIIEDFVWLGINVIILPGTIIHEGAIIQAGSVVHGEIPRCAIAGGNPAKVFRYRDIEHFDKLKKLKKFH